MLTAIVRQTKPEDAHLLRRRDDLAAIRSLLAEREVELAELRMTLKAFEQRYLREVGVLYAELDDVEARIAESEVKLYDSDAARERANAARLRAHETHEAAFSANVEPEAFEPSPDLKGLFRELAKQIHPDFATDAADQEYRTRLMARANKAYNRGDAEALQRILDDFREATDSALVEDATAELIRIERQIGHAKRDIAAIELELVTLPTNEIAQLKYDADTAQADGRDLLTELAASLRDKIADANYRLTFLERQLFAHGR